MGATVRWDYADDIKNHRFSRIADLLRDGKINELNREEQSLLADFLEGRLKLSKGRRSHYDKLVLAEYLHNELKSLRTYGMTTDELAEFFQTNATVENHKILLESIKTKRLNRKQALERLAKRECMGLKNVERLVRIGKELDKEEIEQEVAYQDRL